MKRAAREQSRSRALVVSLSPRYLHLSSRAPTLMQARAARRLTRLENPLRILSPRALVLVAVAMLIAACASVPGQTTSTSCAIPTSKAHRFGRSSWSASVPRVCAISADSRTCWCRRFRALVSRPYRDGSLFRPIARRIRPPCARRWRSPARDAALLVRLVGLHHADDARVRYWRRGSVGADMYVGWYQPGLVSTDYQVATIFTTLFDVKTARPVWTFNPPTYNPASLQRDAPAFASDVVGLLRANGLIAAP